MFKKTLLPYLRDFFLWLINRLEWYSFHMFTTWIQLTIFRYWNKFYKLFRMFIFWHNIFGSLLYNEIFVRLTRDYYSSSRCSIGLLIQLHDLIYWRKLEKKFNSLLRVWNFTNSRCFEIIHHQVKSEIDSFFFHFNRVFLITS